MIDSKKKANRRKHQRFMVREGAFAVMKPGYKNLGQIKNISKGGLAYRHIADKRLENGLYKMDIFLSNKDFYLENVPFKTVTVFDEASEFPYSSVMMKRRCIQFGDLDTEQKEMLNYFIMNHTLERRSRKDRRRAADPNYIGPERRGQMDRRMDLYWV